MARLSHSSGVAQTNTTPDRGAAELTQLLLRLEHTILRADQEREKRLRSSEFERAKINKNLDYARKLLTRLEQEALGIKYQPRKLEIQTDFNHKRELLEQIVDRMHDLEQLHDDGDDSSGAEDILSEIIPTPSESQDSRSAGMATDATEDENEYESEIHNLPPSAEVPSPVAAHSTTTTLQQTPTSPLGTTNDTTATTSTTTTNELRQRGAQGRQTQDEDTAASTARAALFASRRNGNGTSAAGTKAVATTGSTTATAEAILDHQRAEQDELSASMLKMASALKASSQRFSDALEEDKGVLGRAGEGMDRTEKGMDAASRRMGALKRLTEGKGWWGRMILFAWVYGLMVALVLLVFALPKLRR